MHPYDIGFASDALSRRRQNGFRFSQLFHPPDDGGKVFLASGCGFSEIHYRGHLGSGHKEPKLLCRI
jgi:hypothetical protein